MDEGLHNALARVRAELADQPFGDLASVSGKALQSFSHASMEAADNLLGKALLALRAGEPDRARTLVERAAQLPLDDHEETLPAAWSAHMLLYNLVADVAEDSDPDDLSWLIAAERVLAEPEESVQGAMRDVLVEIDDSFELASRESRRLRAAVRPVPPRTKLEDLRVPPDDFAQQLLCLLRGHEVYLAALEQ